MFLAYANIQKDSSRSTIGMCNAVMNTCRVAYYTLSHRTQSDSSLPFHALTLGVVLNVSSLFGLALGNCLSRYVDQAKFMLIILTILFAGSILLATVACSEEVTTAVSTIAGIVFVCIMVARCLSSGGPNTLLSNRDGVKYDALAVVDEEEDVETEGDGKSAMSQDHSTDMSDIIAQIEIELSNL